ncbi:hypothetical protein SAMN05444008_114140 [Cnuella takakiae]|uniref:Uncharacterized protein n=1 Tax=Cnuella takakiae TaxID=1302690 RepID=A0A1M5FSG6_9BACT|nr:hypothetical protein BUE76_18525 [Cnuella takakiae]SHF94453.1 hypothetical protein SAMN05444008_114140 [Cnuella takakiae]
MKQEVQLKYINDEYNFGLVSWKEAYLLLPELVKLNVEYYKGNLIYRAPGSAKRIYYKAIKAGLRKCNIKVYFDVLDLPF